MRNNCNKKITSLFLILAMLFTLCIPSYAATTDPDYVKVDIKTVKSMDATAPGNENKLYVLNNGSFTMWATGSGGWQSTNGDSIPDVPGSTQPAEGINWTWKSAPATDGYVATAVMEYTGKKCFTPPDSKEGVEAGDSSRFAAANKLYDLTDADKAGYEYEVSHILPYQGQIVSFSGTSDTDGNTQINYKVKLNPISINDWTGNDAKGVDYYDLGYYLKSLYELEKIGLSDDKLRGQLIELMGIGVFNQKYAEVKRNGGINTEGRLLTTPIIIEFTPIDELNRTGIPLPIPEGDVPVHKWYYTDGTRTLTSDGAIAVTDSYDIQNEGEYTVTQWVIADESNTEPAIWDDIVPSNDVTLQNGTVLTFSGTSTGVKGSINWQTPPAKELYIRYDKVTATVTGDLLLTEKFISKTFKLSSFTSLQAISISSGRVGNCGINHTPGGPHSPTVIDGDIDVVIDNTAAINTEVQSNGEGFKLIGIGTEVIISAGTSSIRSSITPDANVVIARNKDMPTLAGYVAQGGAVSDLAKLGVTKGKVPKGGRVGDYTSSINLLFGNVGTIRYYFDSTMAMNKSGAPDYTRNGGYGCGRTWNRGTSVGTQGYKATVGVQSYMGNTNLGNAVPVNASNTSFSINGITFDRANRLVSSTGANMSWYPYVQMAYQRNTYGSKAPGYETQVAAVLADTPSTINNRDVVEIGWVSSNANRLKVDSNMWSSHAASQKQKYKVLPGGGLYNLTTNSKQQVGVSVWQTEVDNNFVNNAAISGGNYYSIAGTDSRRNALLDGIKSSLEQLDVTLWVDNWKATGSPFVNKVGMNLYENQKINGVQLIDYDKYMLLRDKGQYNVNKVNEADLDAKLSYSGDVVYTLKSGTNGDVTVYKNWAPLITINKTQGLADLLANAEVKMLDDKTKAVTNFVASIDRNQGNDQTVTNTAWYNECVDAINVVRHDYIYDIGLMTPAARVAALNPNLCPPSTGVGDQYTKFLLAGFKLDNTTQRSGFEGVANCVAVYNSTNITIPDMDKMLVSNYFLIPNATVMDLN